MKIPYKLSIKEILMIIIAFIILMVSIVSVGDFIVLPFIKEALPISTQPTWCRIFYRCNENIHPPLIQYILNGMPWHDMNVDYTILRLKKAVLIGVLSGVAWSLLLTFKRQTQ